MKMNKTTLLLSAAAFLVPSAPLLAQIVPQTGGASVEHINQVPVVNINRAGADGVSHNVYTQFDIGVQGAILNNSLSGANTSLAGAVVGNAQLEGRASKVILNEVNSANKSILKGMVEVAGQRADVVIANKSGITCNGCGFINARNGVLTTADLQFKDGAFNSYRVNQGNIRVEGDGLKKGDVDYTAIIARTAEISAAVHADALLVSAGKKTVSADLSRFNNVEASKDKPEVLVDVAELGGMYANKIKLVANENGVGVNSGNVNGAGSNTGTSLNNVSIVSIQSDAGSYERVQIGNGAQNVSRASVGVANRGQIQAKNGGVDISTDSLVNQGNIASQGQLNISATRLQNEKNVSARSASITATQLDNTGGIQSAQALQLNATSLFNADNGVIEAQNGAAIQGTSITNRGHIVSRTSSVSLSDTRFSNYGRIEAFGDISHRGVSFNNSGTMRSTSGLVTNNGRDINKPVNNWGWGYGGFGWPYGWSYWM
ncbi:TPA: filamentous hemagglutinin N-terminal domain-containing protein [Serratia marcescens]|uniref:Filamentous hemagglutinin N-terminal domain-containing protein n=1 Tax=Serratia marcescens TaxID=615 RepID=A0AB33FMW7_SERMA|nr:filamentous hemagglutinin N-terminal domain-containing protein [Serratia marcescens]AWL67987.1 filamentous hemagglutinin N-terminal domain-containing protein [Serratia marcescens]HAT2209189.1 filamentous hemagglutinin N-terminal domain-containing protein [Serratia marcescens]HAT2220665.1 filamentous hemagglutinin N-terminal domain-containing protein [Serratia marcescens]HAT2272826.1 filamentous hemagglutinin N-terminal domain-containing protein [Serratia marcescens]HAT2331217.1 filamentous 